MIKRSTFITVVLVLVGCNQTNDIRIVKNNSVHSPGETFILELYAPINHGVMPSFFLIDDQDTLALPFNFEKKCALYKATHSIERKHQYEGYVSYATPDNELKKAHFEISYKIKK